MAIPPEGEAVQPQPPAEGMKRPLGLTIISILWLIGGIWNLYTSVTTISMDVELLPYLSHPSIPAWFQMGVPAEIIIYSFLLVLALLQLITIYGLWTGKSWSYRLGLLIPLIIAILTWAELILVVTAPPILELSVYSYILPSVMSIIWVVIYWAYLRQPHVKKYLKVQS